MSIEIKSLVLKLNEQEIEITIEEAKILCEALKEFFEPVCKTLSPFYPNIPVYGNHNWTIPDPCFTREVPDYEYLPKITCGIDNKGYLEISD